jgi:hypothetical protein
VLEATALPTLTFGAADGRRAQEFTRGLRNYKKSTIRRDGVVIVALLLLISTNPAADFLLLLEICRGCGAVGKPPFRSLPFRSPHLTVS